MTVNNVTTGYVAEIVSLVQHLRSKAATIILANAITILSNDTHDFDHRPGVLVDQVRHIQRVFLRVGLHRLDPPTLPGW